MSGVDDDTSVETARTGISNPVVYMYSVQPGLYAATVVQQMCPQPTATSIADLLERRLVMAYEIQTLNMRCVSALISEFHLSPDVANAIVPAQVIWLGSTTGTGVTSWDGRTGDVVMTASDVDTALGYTPYNSTNPSSYVTAAQAAAAAPVQTVAGRSGAVTLTHTDITDWAATLAPYALNSSVAAPSTTLPLMDGVATIGTSTNYAREGHIHPSDTSRLAAGAAASGDLTGTYPGPALVATAVTAGSYTNTNLTVDSKGRITAASNGGVGAPAIVPPLMDGTAAVGTSTNYARQDHVHPSDTSLLALGAAAGGDLVGTYPSPTLTGVPGVIGSYTNSNITVDAKGRVTAASSGPPVGGPATVAPLMDGTAAVGTSPLYTRQDHVHPSDTSRVAVGGAAGGDLVGTYPNPTLGTTGVTAGAYTNANITVDAKGRITVAANGSAGSSGASITVSDTPPASPASGALWWDSVGGNLYLWYQDPNSSEWVIANTGGIADAPTDGNQYARQNQSWTNISAVSAAAPNNTGRNLIHNPVYTVQQRGPGPWTTGGYTADRWQYYSGAGGSRTIQSTVLPDADRTAIGDEAAQFAMQFAVTGSAGAGDLERVHQRVENVARLSSKTVTLSFWAIAASGAPKIGLNLWQYFGSGGSPSASVYALATGASVTLSTTWARYSVTIAVPSVVGKTLGSNGDSFTEVELWFSSGATNNVVAGNIGVQTATFRLWGVQLEVGSVMTPLAKRDPADDLALCQRFYQVGSFDGAGAAVAASNWLRWSWQFPVQMRGSTTVTVNATTNTNVSSLGATWTSYGMSVGGAATAAGNWALTGTYTASADL